MAAPLQPLDLGRIVLDGGNVTTLQAVRASSAGRLETMLGFQPGRLTQGFAVLVLKDRLQPEDFEFDGITLRSGGRHGLPAATADLDRQRRRVHDDMLAEDGLQAYRRKQRLALSNITPAGPGRIVRIRPTKLHDTKLAPNIQYPMGGGALQWKLVREKRFLVAMMVDGHQQAITAEPFSAFLGDGAKYDDRARINRYLERA